MNIVTFVSPVSVSAPKLWMISFFHNTMTKDAFLASKYGILQLLRPQQKVLIDPLGKHSGYDDDDDDDDGKYSKQEQCSKLGYE